MNVGEPLVDADDIADVAAAAFLDCAHVGWTYELTGPRLLTFAAVTDALSRATCRAIRYEPITAAAYGEALAARPARRGHVHRGAARRGARRAQRACHDHVQRALRRPARDFADDARTAAAGVSRDARRAGGAGADQLRLQCFIGFAARDVQSSSLGLGNMASRRKEAFGNIAPLPIVLKNSAALDRLSRSD